MVTNSSKLELENTALDRNMDHTHCVEQNNLIGVAVAFLFVISGNNKYFLHSFDVSYNFNEIYLAFREECLYILALASVQVVTVRKFTHIPLYLYMVYGGAGHLVVCSIFPALGTKMTIFQDIGSLGLIYFINQITIVKD